MSERETLDLSDIEDASSDLFVAAIMADVTEKSLCGIRAWWKTLGHDPSQIAEIVQVDTMLFEIKSKVEEAKAKIDRFVDERCAAERANAEMQN